MVGRALRGEVREALGYRSMFGQVALCKRVMLHLNSVVLMDTPLLFLEEVVRLLEVHS